MSPAMLVFGSGSSGTSATTTAGAGAEPDEYPTGIDIGLWEFYNAGESSVGGESSDEAGAGAGVVCEGGC